MGKRVSSISLLACLAMAFLLSQQSWAQKTAVSYFLTAEKLRRNDNLKQAVFHYDSAIALNPRNHRFYFEKSKCLVYLNREKEAIQHLKQAVVLRPDHIEAYTQLAWLYERQKNYDALIESLEQAASHHRDDRYKIEYRLRILRTLSLIENFGEAAPHLEKVEALIQADSPNYGDLLYYQAKYQNFQGNHNAAIAIAKQGLHITASVENRHVAKFYYELGFAYYKKGEFRNARAAFTYARHDEFEPLIARLSPDYNFSLAKAYFKSHLYKESVAALDKCMSFDKDYPGAIDLKKSLDYRMDNLGAIKTRQNYLSIETDPAKKAMKLADLSLLLLGAEKYSQAVKAADDCLALNGTHWPTVMAKARALWAMGDRANAKKLLKWVGDELGTSGNLSGQAYFMLGRIYLDENNPVAAREAFELAQHDHFYQAAEFELFGLDAQ